MLTNNYYNNNKIYQLSIIFCGVINYRMLYVFNLHSFFFGCHFNVAVWESSIPCIYFQMNIIRVFIFLLTAILIIVDLFFCCFLLIIYLRSLRIVHIYKVANIKVCLSFESLKSAAWAKHRSFYWIIWY